MDFLEVLVVEAFAIIIGVVAFVLFRPELTFWIAQFACHVIVWLGGFFLVSDDGDFW
jgi:hypothetical protein